MGEVDAFELAAYFTLAAVEAAFHVIGHHKTLGGAVERDQLDGLGRTILDTQTAAGAGDRRESQLAAITLSRLSALLRI